MEPKDILKKLHPNQFSDSKIVERVDCPRELLDFKISCLSEENMQFDFEYAIPMKQITVTAGTKITEENPCKAVLMSPEE